MREAEWTEAVSQVLVGKKIVEVQYISKQEADESDWYARPIAIRLDDDTWLVPMADDEGNNGGSISTTNPELEVIPTMY